jgi:hypothetical protein
MRILRDKPARKSSQKKYVKKCKFFSGFLIDNFVFGTIEVETCSLKSKSEDDLVSKDNTRDCRPL